MAAKSGISPVSMENWDQCTDLSPEKHEELNKMMLKIKRSSAQRNWSDSMKLVRTVTNEKRRQSDASEQGHIQSCIDKLHGAIRVDSQQTLLERLESIARPLGLTFVAPPSGSSNKSALILSEMFKVEIAIDPGGGVRDVRITHQGDPTSCEDMAEALSQGRFDEFTAHLQGLMDIYNIPGDMKTKSKAFLALACLENDLNSLAQLQSSIKGVANCIHKSPLGILLPRKGGCPMKLIYFVSPYDLLNKNTKSPHPMTVEAITEHGLGQSVTVCIEEYPKIKPLQSVPLMSVNYNKEGKSQPKFQALTMVNSSELPACFVLVLPQPIPVAMSLVQAIQSLTKLDVVSVGQGNTLLNLVLQQTTKEKLTQRNDEFYVTLPDQQHVYYMSDVSGNSLDQQAILVTRIPFTHPTSVAQVLNILRQQLMFNTVVGSCIRPYAKQDLVNSVVFELAAMSLQHFTVMFEHPLQDTMVTAELDLTDITNAKFKVCIGEEGETICSDDTASKIFQRCLSIPVTLRSVIFKVSQELKREPTPEPATVAMDTTPPFSWQHGIPRIHPRIPFPMDQKGMLQMSSYGTNFLSQSLGMTSPPLGVQATPIRSMLPPEAPPPEQERPSSNPLLATLLELQDSPEPETPKVCETPVLSKLLEDNSNASDHSTTSLASSVPHPPQTKGSRGRPPKRKSQGEVVVKGKSPKHQVTGYDHSVSFDSGHHRQNSMESDIHSQGSMTDSSRQHHLSGASTSSAGSASGTTVIDLTNFTNDSPMEKLKHISDNYIGPKGQMGNHPDNADVFMVSRSDVHNHYDGGKDHDPQQHYMNTFPNAVPKNETRSTSLEDILAGSGEVQKTKDLQNQLNRSFDGGSSGSSNILNSLMRQNSHKNSVLSRQLSMDSNSSFGLPRSVSYQSDSDAGEQKSLLSEALADHGNFNSSKSCDSDTFSTSAMSARRSVSSNSLQESPSLDVKNSDLRQLLMEGKKERVNNFDKDIKIKSEEGKIKMTIPTGGYFPRHNSSELLDISGGRGMKSSEDTSTFDFNSDDDEPFQGSINSASPSRLSSKAKNSKLYQPKNSKSEKYKRKESKSSDSGKRKRDKYEKQDKKYKKKKVSEEGRTSSVEIYRATPVESEDKTSTKLKIFKNNVGLSIENSPKHSPSYREKERSELTKKLSSKEERRSSVESLSGKSKSSGSQKSPKGLKNSSPSITMSRADSKLMNKTPTIKLKPIAIPGSATTNVTAAKTPPASSPSSAKAQSSGGTPTSTTIGRIGAVSLATSGNGKTGTMTPPPAVGNVKSSAPTSAKTPPSVNKSIYSSNKTSASSTSVKPERKLSQSGRLPSGSSKFSNGSTKYSSDRKGGSPSVSGNRNTQTSSTKSSNSSSKGQSSTSPAFGSKNSATNAANVLSFLTNEKGISSLPRIPKISSANVNSSKTAATTATTVTVVTSVSTISTAAKSTNSTQSTVSSLSSRPAYPAVTNSYTNPSKSPINSSGKSPLHGNFNNQVKTGNSTPQGSVKNVHAVLNRPPNIAPNNLGIRSATNSPGYNPNQAKHSAGISGGKSPLGSNSSVTFNKSDTPTSSPLVKPGNSVPVTTVASLSRTNSASQRVQVTRNSPVISSPSSVKPSTAIVVTSPTKVVPLSTTLSSESPRKVNITSPTASISNPVCSTTNSTGHPSAGLLNSSRTKSRKNSLSAVIDKLTSAKSHVSSGSEEDRRNKLEHGDSIEEVELPNCDPTSMKSDSEGSCTLSNCSSKIAEETSESVNTGGKADSAESMSSSESKSGNYVVSNEERSQKTSTQNFSKESKGDTSSRNLFTSILKNTSGSFVPENYKDDKENEIQRTNLDQGVQKEQPGVVDLCKKVQSPRPSPKQNGPVSENSDSAKNDKDLFKVPTPKPLVSEDKDLEDTENLMMRRKQRISTSKPVLSPSSPASSPENLIIDFQTPVSPRTLQNRTNSPLCSIDLSAPEEAKRVNNSSAKVCKVIPSPLQKSKLSPIGSPVVQPLQHIPSPAANSPPADVADIDDDLMNEAIMGYND